MSETRRSFERMVLGLPHSAQDFPAVEVAGELAECLGLQFLGAFIVEPAIFELGGIPGTRELKSIATGWQPIEGDSLARDFQDAVDTARRQFATVARRLNIDTAFHLERGITAEIVASLAKGNDIVVMIEPRNPADRITRQFLSLVEAAFEATSSVMLLPSRVLRKEGPIVVVASGPGDAAIGIAAEMAWAMHESLVIIDSTGQPMPNPSFEADRPVKSRIISVPQSGLSIQDRVSTALAGVRERMIVACRSTFDSAQSRTVADMRGVPVLVTGSG